MYAWAQFLHQLVYFCGGHALHAGPLCTWRIERVINTAECVVVSGDGSLAVAKLRPIPKEYL